MQVKFKLFGNTLKMLGRAVETLYYKACDKQKVIGEVDLDIDYGDGSSEHRHFKNTVLLKGRAALAKCLANEIGDEFRYYIDTMLFGNGGTLDQSPKYVQAEQNGLFGVQVWSRPVIATVSPTNPNVVVFTAVIAKTSSPQAAMTNEMALVMANGDFYSMVTFPDLNKQANMQLTWTWTLTFV